MATIIDWSTQHSDGVRNKSSHLRSLRLAIRRHIRPSGPDRVHLWYKIVDHRAARSSPVVHQIRVL
jgi:hypothetical protein